MSRFKPTPGRAQAPFRPSSETQPKPAGGAGLAIKSVTAKPFTLSPVAVQTPGLPLTVDESKNPELVAAILNTTRQLSFFFTIGFIYVRFSFVHEFLAGHFWIDFHLLLILGGLAMLTCLGSGQLFVALKNTSLRVWLAFICFFALASIFSTWRGQSVDLLTNYLRTNMPLLFLIPAVTVTGAEIKKVFNTIAYAGATTILIGMFTDDFTGGRLEIATAAGSIQNSNDFATHLLLVLPAIAYVTFQRGRNLFLRIAGIVILGLGGFEFAGTGSRGALIAIIAMALYIFVRGSMKLRMALVLGVPALIAIVLPFAPQSAVDRMTSVLASKESVEAEESREARIALFNASMDITLHNPVFGVGPGQFMNVQGAIASGQGERGLWHETHNAYTQISSECGIPAFLCFVTGIYLTMRSLRRSTKANVPFISGVARTLSVMVLGYAVSLIFLSQGYSFVAPGLCAISVTIERYLENTSRTTAPVAAKA